MSFSQSQLFEQTLDFTQSVSRSKLSPIDKLLDSKNFESSLAAFLNIANIKKTLSKKQLINLINFQIAKLDDLINEQINAILHHPPLQKLEASWRGLRYLVLQADESDNVKIRFLDAKWSVIVKDMERAIEFDQSNLFRKIYNNEFGTAGGEPFGVLLGDYSIRHRPGPHHRTDDINALTEISRVAAAAFAPFIANVHPEVFGVDGFYELGIPLNYEEVFSQAEYRKWNAFRETEDSRFVGLTLPHMLMRSPYEHDTFRSDGFNFKEDTSAADGSGYLWGNAVYAFGATLIQSFSNNAWFTDIRGSHAGVGRGGIVNGLNTPSFKTDEDGVALKISTDVLISDFSEKILSELGFIPLCHSKDTEYAVFYGNQSVQGATHYEDKAAEVNAKISAMLQYILCVSRFAHYIKVMGREKVGAFFTADECESYLYNWLLSYSTASSAGTEEHLAKYPLAEAKVEVKEVPGKPGVYTCIAHLKPHMQLDQMVSAVKLVTELSDVKT